MTKLEYENLMTALTLALDAQVSILNIYRALTRYLDTTQEHQLGLELGEYVLKCLEQYRQEKLTDELRLEYVVAIDEVANRQSLLQHHRVAEELYKKALTILLASSQETAKKMSASIYHQLGLVTQDQRQWQQAEHYFQQALHIKIEFNDRYTQANTYGQLGRLAEDQEQWEEARNYFLQALEIFVAYKDTYKAGMTLRGLARVWQANGNAELLAQVAAIVGGSVEEVKGLLREILQGKGEDGEGKKE